MEPQKALREYQLVDLAFSMARDRGANLSDPGCGKTPPTCVWFYWLWTHHQTRSFWVMPKSLLKKNKKELLEFTNFKEEDVLIYDGTPAKRKKLRDTSNAKVWLMGFRRYAEEWRTLKRLHPDFDALGVDEIHMGFGGFSSSQTQEFLASMNYVKRFLPMTGTLINGRLDSAYPTIAAINPLYYSSLEHFHAVHAVKDVDGRIVAWKNHDHLAKIMGQVAVRRSFAEVYGKQEVVPIIEEVEMSPKQAEVYRQWEDQAILELDDRFVDAPNQGVAAIRARQILAHPECIKLPSQWDPDTGKAIAWETHNLIGNEMTGEDERLLIHLADHKNTGKPFIIFGVFQPQLERVAELCRKQGFKVGLIHGGLSQKVRDETAEAFENGELDGLVGSYKTCGVGYNWQWWNGIEQDHIICLDLDYQDSAYLQAIRRAIRGERETPLRVSIFKYADAKVEDRVIEIVERKSEDSNKVDPTNERIQLRDKQAKTAKKPAVKKPRLPAVPSMAQFL